jgi:hypothetical protein
MHTNASEIGGEETPIELKSDRMKENKESGVIESPLVRFVHDKRAVLIQIWLSTRQSSMEKKMGKIVDLELTVKK